MVSYHPDPPQLLRARLRLALHSRDGEDLNRLVHHERGRYSRRSAAVVSNIGAALWHVMSDEMRGLHEARDNHEGVSTGSLLRP